MESKIKSWKEITSDLFTAVLLYSICSVAYSIVAPVNALSMMSGGNLFLTILSYLLITGIIAGYILFIMGLTSFSTILEGNDKDSILKIRTGVILGIIAAVVRFIPLLGWIAGIINIIAFILMLLAYSQLKDSPTFAGRKGASNLFIAMILSLVGVVLGFIPFAGGFIEMVFDIVAFFMILTGWSAIKNAMPEKAKMES